MVNNSEKKEKPGVKVIVKKQQNEEEHIRSLNHENLTFDEKLFHWRGCASTRINSIKSSIETGKSVIGELWPMYKEPFGYKLVRILCICFKYVCMIPVLSIL